MEKKVYTLEAHQTIYKTLFGVKQDLSGMTSLGSYRIMMHNIQINYEDSAEMKQKLNDLIMPYYEDIKADPNKLLLAK